MYLVMSLLGLSGIDTPSLDGKTFNHNVVDMISSENILVGRVRKGVEQKLTLCLSLIVLFLRSNSVM